MRSVMIYIDQNTSGDHMRRNGMWHDRGGEMYTQTDFWWGKTDSGHIGDSKIILKLMLQEDLDQNRYKRRAVLDRFIDHVRKY